MVCGNRKGDGARGLRVAAGAVRDCRCLVASTIPLAIELAVAESSYQGNTARNYRVISRGAQLGDVRQNASYPLIRFLVRRNRGQACPIEFRPWRYLYRERAKLSNVTYMLPPTCSMYARSGCAVTLRRYVTVLKDTAMLEEALLNPTVGMPLSASRSL